jgi:hypothetical protein
LARSRWQEREQLGERIEARLPRALEADEAHLRGRGGLLRVVVGVADDERG